MRQIILLLSIFILSIRLSYAQKTISGTVVDSDSRPLPGVTVAVKNTSTGTITGPDGNYKISVSEGAVLSFSFIGFLTEEVVVGNQSKIDLMLTEDIKGLEEVVVIGYGTTRKKDLTGSVASVDAEVFESRPVITFEQGIQGNVAGVHVASSGGEPGAEMKIKVRGITSINSGNDPLIVVDGFPLSESSTDVGGGGPGGAKLGGFATINPNDIESMEFLKDASATAIYGSRGANGVILITTKKGRTGAPVVSYNGYFGIKSVTKTIDLLDLNEYAEYKHIVTPSNRRYTQRNAERSAIDYSTVESVDWQDVLFRRGAVQNHSISLQGGSEQTKYLMSGAYYNEDAIIIGNSYSKYNFKLSLDQKLWKNARIGTDVNYGLVSNDGIISEGGFDSGAGLLTSALQAAPLDINNPDTWQFIIDSVDQRGVDDILSAKTSFVTPETYALDAQNDTKNERLIANTFFEYIMFRDFKLRVTGGFDINNVKNYRFYPKSTPHGSFYDTQALLGHIRSYSWINENTLSYTKNWSGETSLNVVGGYTQQFNSWEMFRVQTGQFENETLGVNAIQVGLDVPYRPTSSLSEYTMQSFLGRASYNLIDKYLFTVSFRADGVSKFAEGNKWGYFPSAAFAWRLSNEEFIKSLMWLDDLKFRLSYGSIGNSDVNATASHSTLLSSEYSSGNVVIPGNSPANMINRALSWETTNSSNIGFDLAVLNNRINITADYYDKTTVDVLLQAPIATISGFNSVMKNVGKVQNRGIEFALNSYIIDMPSFSWQMNFNFAANKNEVLELTDDDAIIPIGASPDGSYQDDYLIEVGQPIGNMYGYVWEGNYQESDFTEIDYETNTYVLKDDVASRFGGTERPGDIKFKDLNGDLIINEEDRKVIGNGQPKHFGGFNSVFRYKGIELFAGFNWSYGNDIYNFNLKRSTNLTGGSNQLANAWLDRWTPENQNNEHYARYLDQKPSSYWIEDGSFLRFQNLRLAYTIPEHIITRAKISEMQISLSVDNVYIWTNYSGWDPEVSRSGQNLAIGMDYGSYPRARGFLIGLNMKF